MNPVGGFFELEIASGGAAYHIDALALSTGRACLSVILKHVSPTKVYIPFYTCNALIEPLISLRIPYEFYAIDERLEPIFSSPILDNELFLRVNYFGLCAQTITQWAHLYPSATVIDNSQAFFEKSYPDTWSFNSARKFFGVPDGAYLYMPYPLKIQAARNEAFQFDHLINRLTGKQDQAYREFQAYEQSLNTNITAISLLSERLLSNVDYEAVAQKRRENFCHYQSAFESVNQLKLKLDDTAVPYAYPLLLDHPIDRQKLFAQKIFVPMLWHDTLTRNMDGFDFEKSLTESLLPLPVDHRYDGEDCERVIEAIRRLIRT